ncbi:MAG: DUF1361 domain-containing protein [Patescibacteria group bacterium]|nr:MAG: DUF1361 domain-containing protein [Patescibacteria group bacterium]
MNNSSLYQFRNPAAVKGSYPFEDSFIWFLRINEYPIFMVFWNLLLASLAVYLAYRLALLIKEKFSLKTLVVFLLWLLFLPNAAYLMSDIRHISGSCSFDSYGRACLNNGWMIFFFFTYALFGFLSFILSLRPVVTAVRVKWGKLVAAWFNVIIIPLISLGVLLGLLNRWNSWDVFSKPSFILSGLWQYFISLPYLKNWLFLTILFFFLYYLGSGVLKKASWEK